MRPSNPTTVAKAAGRAPAPVAPSTTPPIPPVAPSVTPPIAPVAPSVTPPLAAPARGRRAGKKADPAAAKARLPEAVIMEAVRALSGEDLSAEEGGAAAGPSYGVLFRLTVHDGEGRPASGKHTIRKHLRSAGARTEEGAVKTARILTVTLDASGAAFDFVGLAGAELARTESVAEVFEYFSYELGGMTCVVPRSGYLLRLRARGGLLQITRTPCEGNSIHGAIGKGLMTERAGDTYACKLA